MIGYVQPTEGKEAKRNQETEKCKGEMKGGENKRFFFLKSRKEEEKRKGEHYKKNTNIDSDGQFFTNV